MRKRLPYRLIAATLGLLLFAGVVVPVVQAACAVHMQVDAEAHHESMVPPVASDDVAATQVVASHADDSDYFASTRKSGPCKAALSPCASDCASCCIVETPSSTWTTIRIVDHLSWKGDVPPRYDLVTIIMPRDGDESPHHLVSDASPPISPVRLHVWTATFLT